MRGVGSGPIHMSGNPPVGDQIVLVDEDPDKPELLRMCEAL